MTAIIEGGYYIMPRKTEWIDSQPPHIREIYSYMVRNATHTDRPNGLKRGQLLCTYKQILDDLSWYVGWRKETYSKYHVNTTMKALKKATLITTRKTTRGMVITLCKYDTYQTPANYENHTMDIQGEPQRKTKQVSMVDKKGNNNGKKEKKYSTNSDEFALSLLLLSLILNRKPDYKKPNLQEWTGHIDRMIRLDNRTAARIEEVIRWCQSDDFWMDNILSTGKLRTQFDKLELKMNHHPPKRKPASEVVAEFHQKEKEFRDEQRRSQ